MTLERLAREVTDDMQSMLSAKAIIKSLNNNGIFTSEQLLTLKFGTIAKMDGVGFKRQQIILRMRNKFREWKEKKIKYADKQ